MSKKQIEISAGSSIIRSKSKNGGGITYKYYSDVTKLHPIDQKLALMGKSRAWLAGQIGRSEKSISLYCNRKQVLWPRSAVTQRICEILGISLDFLILGLESPE